MRFLPNLGTLELEASNFKLDAKDKALLSLFATNARQSLSQISRQAKVSRDIASYRLAQYKSQGIIHDARMIVDITALGYSAYHIFLRLSSPKLTANTQFLKQICLHPNVRAVLKFYGKFDLEVAVIAKSFSHFETILSEIIEIVESDLIEYEVVAITKNIVTRSFPLSFIKQPDMKEKQKEIYTIDAVDLLIIEEMRDYANRPLNAIAQKIGISIDILVYRLKKLEKSIVLGYSPVINYGTLGYHITAILCSITKLTKQRQQKISQLLKTDANIIWAVHIFGKYNLLCYICAKTQQEYHQTINRLREALSDELREIESLSAISEYKYTLAPDCLFKKE